MSTYHMDEYMNRRSLYLRILHRLYLVPLWGLVCAVAAGLIYTCVYRLTTNRVYREESTFYIDFAINEDTQTAYDFYNAATWEQLLFTDPDLYEVIGENLPEGTTLEDAQEEVDASLYSDIRVMTVTVDTSSPETTQQVSEAVQKAITAYGDKKKEFTQIRLLSHTEPELVYVDNRTRNAVLLGAVLGLIGSFLLLYLREILRDAIFTPEEAQARYGLPVTGVYGRSEADEKLLPAFLAAQRQVNIKRLLKEAGAGFAKDTDSMADAGSVTDTGSAKNACPAAGTGSAADAGPARKIVLLSAEAGAAEEARKKLGESVTAGSTEDPETYEKLGPDMMVLLVIPFGKGAGCRTENLLGQVRQSGAQAAGILLTEADGKFLRRYYQAASGKSDA